MHLGLVGKSLRAAIGATISTGALGSMLAIVFLLSGRSLARASLRTSRLTSSSNPAWFSPPSAVK